MAVRGPGVEEHQAVHQSPGPATSGCRFGRPSRRRFSSFPLCADGAVRRQVEVFRFAGHGCSLHSLSIGGRRGHRSAPHYLPLTVRPCGAHVACPRRDGPHAPIDRSAVLARAGRRDGSAKIVGPVQICNGSPTRTGGALRQRPSASAGPGVRAEDVHRELRAGSGRHRLRQGRPAPRRGDCTCVKRVRTTIDSRHSRRQGPFEQHRAPAARWDQLRGRCRSARELVPR
jgi:hypothetical protein